MFGLKFKVKLNFKTFFYYSDDSLAKCLKISSIRQSSRTFLSSFYQVLPNG
ncbi:CLUMA_CG002136, isoform A [Clunio marinus]|uniref:CLUMA_CG002136, isoform A n=1 Tax=Clunio marinus TaxID=568069 RepID=A0A1J1HJZ0_9DIPT|nr:CLUMA_CG002136, isoform A [Clunio marinus]